MLLIRPDRKTLRDHETLVPESFRTTRLGINEKRPPLFFASAVDCIILLSKARGEKKSKKKKNVARSNGITRDMKQQ